MDQIEKNNLKKTGIGKKKTDLNKIILMSKGEGLKHFLTKCILFWLLRMENHDIYTEAPIKNYSANGTKYFPKIDLIDMTSRVLFEIETHKSVRKFDKLMKKKNANWKDLLIIDSFEIPYELNKQIKKLSEKLSYYGI